MRILDRYSARQVIPVWLWCILLFVFLTCIIDLFGRLDEILQYRIPIDTVGRYYLSLIPLVFVKASPLALLFGAAFIATRLVRHQELLAMNASGTSLMRASVPFVFVGWLVSVVVFVVNEQVVPPSAVVYERLQEEMYAGKKSKGTLENAVTMDAMNRLYHARTCDPKQQELTDLTVLEHDAANRPKKTINAKRAILTRHGWLLLYGTLSRLNPNGSLNGFPEPFVERVVDWPVTIRSFSHPETQPETLSFSQLRRMIQRLESIGVTNVRRYAVELAAKITLPLMNLVIALIGFIGATRPTTRGQLRGLGTSLLWGTAYYLGVAVSQAVGTEGFVPALLAAWLPHLIALGVCWRLLRRQS